MFVSVESGLEHVARPRAFRSADPYRWVRLGCEMALRVAILAAALCPALSALGGSVVAALLAATGRLARRAEKPRRAGHHSAPDPTCVPLAHASLVQIER